MSAFDNADEASDIASLDQTRPVPTVDQWTAKNQQVIQAATKAAIEILNIPVLNDYMIPDMAEIIGRYIHQILAPEMQASLSERDWSEHLRIQLAAEIEKVNKLQEQLTAEREKVVSVQELVLKRDAEIAQLTFKLAGIDKQLFAEAIPKSYEPDRALVIETLKQQLAAERKRTEEFARAQAKANARLCEIESEHEKQIAAVTASAITQLDQAYAKGAAAERELVKAFQSDVLAERKAYTDLTAALAAERKRADQQERFKWEANKQLDAEKESVAKVWKALGISTYDQAKPLTVWEHVAQLREKVLMLEDALIPCRGMIAYLSMNVDDKSEPETTAKVSQVLTNADTALAKVGK